jgi:ribonuclease P protein component
LPVASCQKTRDWLLAAGNWAVQDGELVRGDGPKPRVEQPAAKAGGSIPRGLARGFPRAGRLRKHSDFERVYKQGRRHFSPHMTVFYLRRAAGAVPEKGSRVGFTVGRVLGGAVERNRMKRRLREAVRLRRSSLDLALEGAGAVDVVGVDVVINPKKSVLKLEFAVVLEEVGRALDAIAKKLVEK